jgi:hypothetical protein
VYDFAYIAVIRTGKRRRNFTNPGEIKHGKAEDCLLWEMPCVSLMLFIIPGMLLFLKSVFNFVFDNLREKAGTCLLKRDDVNQ